ncbi:MAG: glycosyltransferase family 4 protein [Elusimicrobiota bacterium]
MNILHVTDAVDFSGGVKQVMLLMQGIAAARPLWRQEFCCPPESPVARAFADAGFAIFPNKMFQDYDLAAAWRLRNHIKRSGVRLVHAHHPTAHAVCLVARYLTDFKLVVSRRVSHPLPWYPTTTFKYCNERIDKLIGVSSAVTDLLTARGVPKDRLAVVGSSTDLDRFAPRPPDAALLRLTGLAGAETEPFVIGLVANYSPWKGHDLLLEALASLRGDWLLVAAGRDTDSGAFLAKAAACGVDDKVRALGWRKDVPEILSICDLLVCPSSSGEGSSGAIREASAMGIPVLASDIPANTGLIDDERGWLFKNGSASELCRVITGIISTPRPDLQRKATHAQEFVRRNFSVEVMVSKTVAVYEELVT